MKRGAIYLITLAFWGCSSDPVVVPETGTTTTLVLHATQTKASPDAQPDSLLTGGTATGIFVTQHQSSPADAFCSNKEFTATANGSLIAADTVYLTEHFSYDIYGYAPYTPILANPGEVEFAHGTDVLWCPKVTLTDVTQNNRSALLHFEHRMAQISFNVGFDEKYNGSRLFTTTSEISITGFCSKGKLNIETGNIVPSGGFDVRVDANAQPNEKGDMVLTVPRTCFVAAGEPMKLAIQVKHGNETFKAGLEEVFNPGTSYKYTVKITHVPELTVNGKVLDWRLIDDDTVIVE